MGVNMIREGEGRGVGGGRDEGRSDRRSGGHEWRRKTRLTKP